MTKNYFSHHLFSRLSIGLLFISLCCSGWATDKHEDAKLNVHSQYEPILKLINERFPSNQSAFDNDPQLLAEFLNQHVRVHWDASSTTSALIGKETFLKLAPDQKQRLVAAVDQTLLRYAMEGYQFYNGQQFNLAHIAISSSGNMGWLKILMESPIIPDLNLELLIKRNQQGVWKAVDVRFKGITYVAIKKHLHRRLIKKKGIDGLIDNLTSKNRDFFEAM